MVVNGEKSPNGFNSRINFSEHLIPYHNDTSWIEKELDSMVLCMNSNSIPDSNESCENCAYALERGKLEQPKHGA